MPTIAATAALVFAQFQAAFVTSTATPASWQLTVGQEVVGDIDAVEDWCCSGLGAMLVPELAMEVGTSQLQDGTLYTRMSVTLAVFRCAPMLDNAGRSPTPADHLAYTNRVLDDAERLMHAVWAVAGFDWITEEDISDPTWQALPVEGGCGGGAVSFEMAVIGDCPTP